MGVDSAAGVDDDALDAALARYENAREQIEYATRRIVVSNTHLHYPILLTATRVSWLSCDVRLCPQSHWRWLWCPVVASALVQEPALMPARA